MHLPNLPHRVGEIRAPDRLFLLLPGYIKLGPLQQSTSSRPGRYFIASGWALDIAVGSALSDSAAKDTFKIYI